MQTRKGPLEDGCADKRKNDKDFCLKGKSHVISLYLARHLAPRIKKLARKIEGDKGLWKRAKDKGEHDEIDKKSWFGWFIQNVSAFFVHFSECFKRMITRNDDSINAIPFAFLKCCELALITIRRSCNTIVRNIKYTSFLIINDLK